jgi:uncharacterized membrane protein
MLFVLLSAVCSVLVSVLLKIARRYAVDVAQAITWNYLAAAVLCALLLQPPLTSLTQPGAPWFALLGLAAVLPSLFLVLAASVRRAGIVRTDIAQRLSLLLSLLAAFFVFGEPRQIRRELDEYAVLLDAAHNSRGGLPGLEFRRVLFPCAQQFFMGEGYFFRFVINKFYHGFHELPCLVPVARVRYSRN